MDRDYVPFLLGFLLGLAMMAVGIAGEFLGWWNDIGEVLSVGGFALALFSLLQAALLGASRRQVRGLHTAVESVASEVRGVREDVRGVRGEVGAARREAAEAAARQEALLVQIRDKL